MGAPRSATRRPGAAPAPTRIELPTTKSTYPMQAKDNIMMFYGPPGIGKTTFVNSLADRVLFVSTDRGTRYQKALRVEVGKWEDVVKVCGALETRARDYDMVCLDHIDDIAMMAEQWVCAELGIEALGDAGYGKGWKAYKGAMQVVVHSIMRSGLGLVFIAHEVIKTVRTRAIETERTMPRMTKSAWDLVIPLCDLVGYCGFQRVKRPRGTVEIRALFTDPREDLYAKDRTSRKKPRDSSYEQLDGATFINTFIDKE